MRARVLFILAILCSVPAFAQTAAIQGFCNLGGAQAKTSGLDSTNYQQGIIPSCTVAVYLTGTTTKATIYADGSNTPLSNPFTAAATGSAAPGQWIFWAAVNQGYDVVMSGGISPNTYPQPVTLTDVFPSTQFVSPSGGCTTDCVVTDPTGSQNTTALTLANKNICLQDGTNCPSESGGFAPLIAGSNVVFTGDSRLIDDSGNTLGQTYTATAVSCTNAGLCTVTSANSFTAGQQILINKTFSPSCAELNVATGGPYTYGTGNGQYSVLASGLSSTQFEIQTSACTATTGTGGTFEDAQHMVPAAAAALPGFTGIGAWYLINSVDEQNSHGGISGQVCSQSTNYAQMFHALSPEVTGTPGYLIELSGFTDANMGDSAATVEGCFSALFASAHADGWKVIEIIPASGTMSTADANVLTQVQGWLMLQGKGASNTSSGAYWDMLGSWNAAFDDLARTSYANGAGFNVAGAAVAASLINSAVTAPGSALVPLSATSMMLTVYNSLNVGAQGSGGRWTITPYEYGSTDIPYESLNQNVGSWGGVIDSFHSISGGIARVYGANNVICWNSGNISNLPIINPCDTALSRDSAGVLDIGTGAAGNSSGSFKFTNLYGPATAPSGSCTASGAFELTQDGGVTRCLGGTWTAFALPSVRAGSWSISASTSVAVTFSPAMGVAPSSCSVTPSASSATTGTPFATSLATTGFTVNVPTSGTLAGTYQCVVNNSN